MTGKTDDVYALCIGIYGHISNGLASIDDQDRLADAGVNIYGHLFIGRWGDQAQFSFVVSDVAAARKALEGLSSIHAG